MTQAQQIRSNFLQNHESTWTWIVNQKFFEIRGNTVNNMKLTVIAKIGETCTRFLQPTRRECVPYFCWPDHHFGESFPKISWGLSSSPTNPYSKASHLLPVTWKKKLSKIPSLVLIYFSYDLTKKSFGYFRTPEFTPVYTIFPYIHISYSGILHLIDVTGCCVYIICNKGQEVWFY
jgi:hypothetical protein